MQDELNIYDEFNFSHDKMVEDFFRLTREALDTDSTETFFAILMEREALCSSFEQFSISLSPESITKMLFIEKKILKRLENERRKIMIDIDKLSRQMKIARVYSAQFPFPTMPAFFDQAG
jgi:hypothetical protein